MSDTQRSPKPGPRITVNGVEYTTVYTGDVQRFPENRAISILLNTALMHGVGLNQLWIAQQEGHYTIDEMRELYRLIGISIGSYVDTFVHDVVENPAWAAGESKGS